MSSIIQVKRGTAAGWTSANPTLNSGEIGFETDTKKMKVGDGSTAWTSLGYTATDGDISGVTAGTGLSGGGNSGAVTLTNTMATEITAKGDLIVGTGNAAFDNLPVGTDGFILQADSVETTGLKWAAAPSSTPGFKGFSASINSGATPAASTYTKVPFGSEAYDTEGWYNTSLYRFLPTTSGYYRITLSVFGNATGRNRFDLYKNGLSILRVFDPSDNHKGILGHSGITVNLNGSSDYIEVYSYFDGTTGPWQQGTDVSNFSAFYLGA